MMNCDFVRSMTKDQFNTVIEFIGLEAAITWISFYGENVSEKNKYHIGKRNGMFWKGFRIETLPLTKILQFYTSAVKNMPDDLLKTFQVIIIAAMGIPPEEKENEEMIKEKIKEVKDPRLLPILSKMFDVEMDISFEKYKEDIENTESRYKEMISKIETEHRKELYETSETYRKKINGYNVEIQKLENEKNKAENENSRLENEINELKKQNTALMEKRESLISRLKNNWMESGLLIDRMEEITDQSQKKEIFRKMMEETENRFNKNEDISENLIIEYLLYKLMEE